MSEAMSHPSPDELVLHYYGESANPEALETHVAACPECRAAFESLRTALGGVATDEPPTRGADYGAQAWQMLEPKLRMEGLLRAASPQAPVLVRPPGRFRPFAPRRLVWTGALAASLVAAFLLGRYTPRPGGVGTSGPVRERILLLAVGDHLDRSQVVLLELLNADPHASLDVTAEQRSAENLLSDNRLYRQAAVRSGDAGVARTLEELERVLIEVANGPSELAPEDLAALRRRIESQGVLFRVRVIGSQIREREKEAVQGPPKVEL
jgi:hypothetical protein